MQRYPERTLWEELTFLGMNVHWSLDDLLDLSHRDRTRLVRLVAEMSERRRTVDARG